MNKLSDRDKEELKVIGYILMFGWAMGFLFLFSSSYFFDINRFVSIVLAPLSVASLGCSFISTTVIIGLIGDKYFDSK